MGANVDSEFSVYNQVSAAKCSGISIESISAAHGETISSSTDCCVFVETSSEQGYFNPLEIAAHDARYDGVVATLEKVVCVRHNYGLFAYEHPILIPLLFKYGC